MEKLDLVLPSIQRVLYTALQSNELPTWATHLRIRVSDKGYNPVAFAQGLEALPRALTQLQRWHLFRIHVNGHMSSSRLKAARQAPIVLPCPLCGTADDSARHCLQCATAVAAFNKVVDALPPHVQQPASWTQLFFQAPCDPDIFHFTLGLFTAAWVFHFASIHSKMPSL